LVHEDIRRLQSVVGRRREDGEHPDGGQKVGMRSSTELYLEATRRLTRHSDEPAPPAPVEHLFQLINETAAPGSGLPHRDSVAMLR
jgi:hypothetical protein